jgi:hypothetical protein
MWPIRYGGWWKCSCTAKVTSHSEGFSAIMTTGVFMQTTYTCLKRVRLCITEPFETTGRPRIDNRGQPLRTGPCGTVLFRIKIGLVAVFTLTKNALPRYDLGCNAYILQDLCCCLLVGTVPPRSPQPVRPFRRNDGLSSYLIYSSVMMKSFVFLAV